MWFIPVIWHHVAVWAGLTNASGAQYLFWSGIVGDFTLAGVFYTMVRKHNCEIHHCWRIGKHQSAAGHMLCRKHHPDDHLTVEQAHAAHQAAIDDDE